MTATLSCAATYATAPWAPFSFERRAPGDENVTIDADAFLPLLKLDGTMTLVGAPATPPPSPGIFVIDIATLAVPAS